MMLKVHIIRRTISMRFSHSGWPPPQCACMTKDLVPRAGGQMVRQQGTLLNGQTAKNEEIDGDKCGCLKVYKHVSKYYFISIK